MRPLFAFQWYGDDIRTQGKMIAKTNKDEISPMMWCTAHWGQNFILETLDGPKFKSLNIAPVSKDDAEEIYIEDPLSELNARGISDALPRSFDLDFFADCFLMLL